MDLCSWREKKSRQILLHNLYLKVQLLWLQHGTCISDRQGGSSWCTGGAVLKVQAVGFTLGFEDRVESSRETSRVLFAPLLCQCSASLRGVCQFLS